MKVSCDDDQYWTEVSISYIGNEYDVVDLNMHPPHAESGMFTNEAGTPPVSATA